MRGEISDRPSSASEHDHGHTLPLPRVTCYVLIPCGYEETTRRSRNHELIQQKDRGHRLRERTNIVAPIMSLRVTKETKSYLTSCHKEGVEEVKV